MISYAEMDAETRPDFPVRTRPGGMAQVQCPHCGAWRPGFCVVQLDEAEATARNTEWACDGDLTRWARDES